MQNQPLIIGTYLTTTDVSRLVVTSLMTEEIELVLLLSLEVSNVENAMAIPIAWFISENKGVDNGSIGCMKKMCGFDSGYP